MGNLYPTRREFIGGILCALAAGPAGAVESRGLVLREVVDGIWIHTSWQRYGDAYSPSNGLFVLGDRAGLLIDTACLPGDTETLLDRIEDHAPLRLLVTHAHDDRMAGLDNVHRQGIPSLAHEGTARAAVAEGLGAVTETWTGRSHRLTVGGRRIELLYPGPAHTDDNIVAYVPDARLLFGGCMLRETTAATLGGLGSSDVRRWPKAVKRVMKAFPKAEIVVPGHGMAGGRDLLDHTLALAEAER